MRGFRETGEPSCFEPSVANALRQRCLELYVINTAPWLYSRPIQDTAYTLYSPICRPSGTHTVAGSEAGALSCLLKCDRPATHDRDRAERMEQR